MLMNALSPDVMRCCSSWKVTKINLMQSMPCPAGSHAADREACVGYVSIKKIFGHFLMIL